MTEQAAMTTQVPSPLFCPTSAVTCKLAAIAPNRPGHRSPPEALRETREFTLPLSVFDPPSSGLSLRRERRERDSWCKLQSLRGQPVGDWHWYTLVVSVA